MNKQLKSQYQPDFVTAPGETLQEKIDELGMTQRELAERMGRPRKTINEIIQGKAAITAETALQLELVLNVPAKFWLNREASYRASIARDEENKRLEGQVDLISKLPIKKLVEFGWIPDRKDKTELLKEILSFFGVASSDKIPLVEQVAFRKSEKYAVNPWALAAWLRRGEIEAASKVCPEYDSKNFQEKLLKLRELTNLAPSMFVPVMVDKCFNAGVILLFVRELPQTKVSGASRWIKGNPVIQMSLLYKSNDHFWFTFFHEAVHVLREHKKDEIFLEAKLEASLDPMEAEANEVAGDLLIPKDSYNEFLRANQFSDPAIRKFAGRLKLAPAIVVGRLQHDKCLAHSHGHRLRDKYTWENWPIFC